MQETDPCAAVRAFQARRRATLARLQRVNVALARWDEHDAAILLPPEVRPHVEAPTLSRAALKELQAMLGGSSGNWKRPGAAQLGPRHALQVEGRSVALTGDTIPIAVEPVQVARVCA